MHLIKKKGLREIFYFAPLNEEGVPQNKKSRYAFFLNQFIVDMSDFMVYNKKRRNKKCII